MNDGEGEFAFREILSIGLGLGHVLTRQIEIVVPDLEELGQQIADRLQIEVVMGEELHQTGSEAEETPGFCDNKKLGTLETLLPIF